MCTLYLQDSIVSLGYCVLWLIASIIVTVYGSEWDIPALKGAAVSPDTLLTA